jgi:hypothetical protein
VVSSQIRAFDFGRPVIDFCKSTAVQGAILVLLDPNFQQELSASDEDVPLAKIVQLTGMEVCTAFFPALIHNGTDPMIADFGCFFGRGRVTGPCGFIEFSMPHNGCFALQALHELIADM